MCKPTDSIFDDEPKIFLPESYPPTTVHVALVLPNSDGSGNAQALGVYTTRLGAEARLYRNMEEKGYAESVEIVELVLNE